MGTVYGGVNVREGGGLSLGRVWHAKTFAPMAMLVCIPDPDADLVVNVYLPWDTTLEFAQRLREAATDQLTRLVWLRAYRKGRLHIAPATAGFVAITATHWRDRRITATVNVAVADIPWLLRALDAFRRDNPPTRYRQDEPVSPGAEP
jgi:hypothetical protein